MADNGAGYGAEGGGGGGNDGGADGFVVRCRGLPWSATPEEMVNFFSGSNIRGGTDGVHMTTNRDGRPSGEAYVELEGEEDVESALKKDRQHMGKRYVEVFRSKLSEMEWVLNKNGGPAGGGGDGGGGGGGGGGGYDDYYGGGEGGGGGAPPLGDECVIKLRGLPYESGREDILKFFEGLEITANGVLLTTTADGRSSGEAFVQFGSAEHAERALEKNKQSIGHRYIEIFRSSMEEASRAMMMSGGPHGGGGGPGGYRGGPPGGGVSARGGGGRDFYGRRPGPYDRGGAGPPLGRGYGAYGPRGGGGGFDGGRGSRSFRGFGGDDYYDDESYYGSGGGFARGGGGGGGGGGPPGGGYDDFGRYVVRMRGLPFRATENDIAEWFSSVADPVDILIKFNNQGKPNGEADVLFRSDADARRAMTKDRQNMQHRYVELFYDGDGGGRGGGPGGRRGGYGGGGGRGGDF